MNEGTTRLQDARELIRRLCIALTNAEAFSAEHPLAKKNIEGTFECLQGILRHRQQSVVISVSDKRIFLDGIPLEDTNPLVGKLAGRLDDLHATHLSFAPEITAEEFLSFFRILGKGPRYVNENGGLVPLLQAAHVSHIQLREISYVMLTEDQKVVDKKDKIVPVGDAQKPSLDADIVQYVMGKVLQKTEEQKWLLNEMKNNPQRVADLFVEGIGLASSRAEMGMADEGAGVAALLRNIQLVGQTLEKAELTETEESQEDLAKAVMVLDNEMRQRSGRLTSSKVAAGLINEILGVIAAYNDRVRARKISDEFIHGEKGLQKAEEMLRHLTPASESVDKFLTRIRTHLVRRGLNEEQLTQLEHSIQEIPPASAAPALDAPVPGVFLPLPEAPAEVRPRRPRKPRKKYSDNVFEGVAKRLKELQIEGVQSQQAVESLSTFVEERARERIGELRYDVDRLKYDVARRDSALQKLPWGVVLWQPDGKLEFLNRAAQQKLSLESGVRLSESLKAALKESTFPLPSGASLNGGLGEAEIALLRSVSFVLRDDSGDVYGAILVASSTNLPAGEHGLAPPSPNASR